MKQDACWERGQGGDHQAGRMMQSRPNTHTGSASVLEDMGMHHNQRLDEPLREKSLAVGHPDARGRSWLCQSKQSRQEAPPWLMCWWLQSPLPVFPIHCRALTAITNNKEQPRSQFLTGSIVGEIKHSRKPVWASV